AVGSWPVHGRTPLHRAPRVMPRGRAPRARHVAPPGSRVVGAPCAQPSRAGRPAAARGGTRARPDRTRGTVPSPSPFRVSASTLAVRGRAPPWEFHARLGRAPLTSGVRGPDRGKG